MAKVFEDILVLKLSRIVKDTSNEHDVIDADQRKLIIETIPTLVEEIINDTSVIVEIAELE